MELLGFEVPLWAVLLPTILLSLYYYFTKDFDVFTKIGVSGPTPLPAIGTALDFMRKPFPTMLHDYRMKYGRVFGTFLGTSPILNVADAEFIKEVTVKQFSKFTDRRPSGFRGGGLDRALTVLQGDHWKHVRSQLTGAFTSGKLKQMLLLINENVNDLVNNLSTSSGKEVEVKEYTGAYTLDAIASTAFGMMVDSQKSPDAPFLKHAKKFFDLRLSNPKTLLIFAFPTLGKIFTKLGITFFPKETLEYFTSALQGNFDGRTKQDERKDFIDIALKHKVDIDKEKAEDLRLTGDKQWSVNGITDEEVMSNALIFFLAGYETTATLLQYAMYALALNPDIQDRLRTEIEDTCQGEVATYDQLGKMLYLDGVIHETLRKYSPAVLADRFCKEDVVIKGVKISKGMGVNLLFYEVHHDPEYWPEPEVFNPERFFPENKPENFQSIFLPFGVGPRNCIGMRLALLEAKAALARIIQKFDVETTPSTPTEPLDLKIGSGFLKTVKPLTLKLTKRSK